MASINAIVYDALLGNPSGLPPAVLDGLEQACAEADTDADVVTDARRLIR
jgi:hypothetical protein